MEGNGSPTSDARAGYDEYGRPARGDGVSLTAVTLYRPFVSHGGRQSARRRRRRAALHQAQHFPGLGVAPDGFLGEDPTTVHLDLEHAAG